MCFNGTHSGGAAILIFLD